MTEERRRHIESDALWYRRGRFMGAVTASLFWIVVGVVLLYLRGGAMLVGCNAAL